MRELVIKRLFHLWCIIYPLLVCDVNLICEVHYICDVHYICNVPLICYLLILYWSDRLYLRTSCNVELSINYLIYYALCNNWQHCLYQIFFKHHRLFVKTRVLGFIASIFSFSLLPFPWLITTIFLSFIATISLASAPPLFKSYHYH